MENDLNTNDLIKASCFFFLGNDVHVNRFLSESIAIASCDALVGKLNNAARKCGDVDFSFNKVTHLIRAYIENAVDGDWYLSRYDDVLSAGMNAHEHFNLYGRTEGRYANLLAEKCSIISLYLDSAWYLNRYADIAESGTNPDEHFKLHGRGEGRFPNRLAERRSGLTEYFDSTWYLSRYVDVAQSEWRPIDHYITYGQDEGRFPNETAEDNSNRSLHEIADFISIIHKQLLERNLDYFEFAAWKTFYLFGFSEFEFRKILEFTSIKDV